MPRNDTPTQSTSDGGGRQDPYVEWFPVEEIERQISLRYINYASTFLVHWGDEASELVGAGATATHTYRVPARYQVVLQEPGPGAILAETPITIRPGTDPQGIEFGPNPDNPLLYQARFTTAVDTIGVIPELDVDWGDESDPQRVWAVPGTVLERPLPTGTYTIAVTDLGTRRALAVQRQITGRQYDPEVSIARAAGDTTGRAVTVTITQVNRPYQRVVVEWGEPFVPPTVITDAAAGSTATHTYGPARTRALVRVTYADGVGNEQARDSIIPLPLPATHQSPPSITAGEA